MHPVELESNRLRHAQQPLKFGPVELATRMTVVRLSDGSLWVHLQRVMPAHDQIIQDNAVTRLREAFAWL